VTIATFNQLEACLWFFLGIVLTLSSRHAKAPKKKTMWTAAAAFLIFGVSDLIEANTGAWWRPLWLLFLKAACIAVLVGCYLRYQHLSKP
jgi:hypothetical protein